jgi:hypothetical protein
MKRNQRGIYCEDCTYWYHIKCIDLPIDEYQRLSTSSESWYCANCILYFTGPGLVEMSPDSKRILIIDVYVVLFWFGKYL